MDQDSSDSSYRMGSHEMNEATSEPQSKLAEAWFKSPDTQKKLKSSIGRCQALLIRHEQSKEVLKKLLKHQQDKTVPKISKLSCQD